MGRQDRPDPGHHALETLLRVEDLRVAACGELSVAFRTPSAPSDEPEKLPYLALAFVIVVLRTGSVRFASTHERERIARIAIAPSERIGKKGKGERSRLS